MFPGFEFHNVSQTQLAKANTDRPWRHIASLRCVGDLQDWERTCGKQVDLMAKRCTRLLACRPTRMVFKCDTAQLPT